jgi:hypothetical protein
MKFELELEGHNKMVYKTDAIAKVLARELGGKWNVKEIPSEPIPYPIEDQVNDFVQGAQDRAGRP